MAMGLYDAHTKEKREAQTVKANFPYIDALVEERVKPNTEAKVEERIKAKEKARGFVAGFVVEDPEKEKAALDEMIERRNATIRTFISDRTIVRSKLKGLGITALAVVPSKAWAKICQNSGLVVMTPDSESRVTISRATLQRYGSAKNAEAAAKSDHAAYVKALFPAVPEIGMQAKVILPTPPADVVAILMKAKSLALNVAAEPEAIRFVETPTELYNNSGHPRDEWARRQGYADYADWVKRDPIVFHNQGTASAIIAQFGDFPIEKMVVDAVMENDDLIPESPSQAITQATINPSIAQAMTDQVTLLVAGGSGGYAGTAYHREMARLRYEAQRQTMASGQVGLAGLISGRNSGWNDF